MRYNETYPLCSLFSSVTSVIRFFLPQKPQQNRIVKSPNDLTP